MLEEAGILLLWKQHALRDRQSACILGQACTLLWTITELAAEQRAEGVSDAGMLPDGLPFSRPDTKGTQC